MQLPAQQIQVAVVVAEQIQGLTAVPVVQVL
jgi:hypothetical protein